MPTAPEAMKSNASSRRSLPSSSSSIPRTGTPVSRPHSAAPIKSEASLVRVKPEPTENALPRKRLSEVAFDPTEAEEPQPKDNSTLGLTKKLKREPSSKIPFATVTNTSMTGGSQVADVEWVAGQFPVAMGSYYDPHDPMVMLDDVRLAIVGQQNLLDQIMYRPGGPTQWDYQRINACQEELARLLALEQRYSAMMASTSSAAGIQNQPFVNPEPASNLYPLLAARGRQSLDRAPALPPPPSFPVPMEVDHKPFPQPVASTSQAPYVQSYPATEIPASYTSPPPTLKHEPEEKKPFIQTNPLASRSRVSLPFNANNVHPQPEFLRYDSEPYESDASSQAPPGMAPIQNLLDRVGINVPPPIDNDAIDDNGDYHGRGRDLFEGPQAKHDE